MKLQHMHTALRAFACFMAATLVHAQPNSDPTVYPGQDRTWEFHGAAGTDDTTAVWKEDPSIVGWATGFTGVQYGEAVDEKWRTPTKALGAAVGDSFDIVCLGRGGQITLTFANPITNGSGFDFAVFENGFADTFLELGWVEVSTDGVHFVRFPNFSYTPGPAGGLDPTQIHGYASKYRQGYGTPFDLEQLQLAYDAAVADTDLFSSGYKQQLLENFNPVDGEFDLNEINYVRIVDIVGDGTALDCEGVVVYDPYPTSGSAGVDLDAIAVFNQVAASGVPQTIEFPEIGHQRFGDGSVQLLASTSSTLVVAYEIVEGPAQLNGSTLSFTGLGQVVVRAVQAGDETYAPAAAVTRSFTVADELQHLFFVPVSNQLVGATNVQLSVFSSSGLPVSLVVDDGPLEAIVGEFGQLFSSGSNAGEVLLRASQTGGELGGVVYAPADDVLYRFDVVAADSSLAPRSLSQWRTDNSLPLDSTLDSDGDGSSDLAEYVGGTDANDASDQPDTQYVLSESTMQMVITVSQLAQFELAVETATELSAPSPWADVVPRVVSQQYTQVNGEPVVLLTLEMPRGDASAQFWRLSLDAN